MRFKSLVILILLAPLLAWSKTGHRVVAQIAQEHLTPETISEVMLLTGGRDLADFSNWADEIKTIRPKTKKWHYTRDFSLDNEENNSLYQALNEQIKQLKDSQDSDAKLESLKWIVHLVADIHQPLHVGNGIDNGGNACQVYWFGSKYPVKLHYVWDQLLIRHTDYSYTEYARYLNHIDPVLIDEYQQASILDWFQESIKLHDDIYPKQYPREMYCKGYSKQKKEKKYPRLFHQYVYDMTPILEKRLQQAGVRLGHLLNQLFLSSDNTAVL